MSSQRKILANRRNAMKSTGPKSRSGKASSSRNARKNGLSQPLNGDDLSVRSIEIASIISRAYQMVVGDSKELSKELELLRRIRNIRDKYLNDIEIWPAEQAGMDRVPQPSAQASLLKFWLGLDGYEPKARSRLMRRLRAARP